jgi:hypothetical protein
METLYGVCISMASVVLFGADVLGSTLKGHGECASCC